MMRCGQARHPRRRSPIISPAEPRPGRGGPARRRHVARGGAPLLTCPRRVRGAIATDGYRWRGRVLVAPHPHRARGWAGASRATGCPGHRCRQDPGAALAWTMLRPLLLLDTGERVRETQTLDREVLASTQTQVRLDLYGSSTARYNPDKDAIYSVFIDT